MTRLPIDVIHLIMTEVELDESKETLLACSLVSRAWLSPSRSHLFRAVKIHGWQKSFAAFDEFLGAAQHVSEYIRDLALAGDYRILTPGSVDPHMVTAYDTLLEVETVHSILLKLPALRRLCLENLRLVGSLLMPIQDRPPSCLSLSKAFQRPHILIATYGDFFRSSVSSPLLVSLKSCPATPRLKRKLQVRVYPMMNTSVLLVQCTFMP
ncbi:hypothetical protein C8Q74DRAFT_425776 [Fomes fomentarius]|nr:hypothetical protein C8Q74DRAFT_425776 [Fomes fomentarius]